jgi:hypothetical protein
MFRDSSKKMRDSRKNLSARLDPSSGAAGVLMGFDGIPVGSYVRPGSPVVMKEKGYGPE